MAKQPTRKQIEHLEKLAAIALRAKIKFDAAKAEAEKTKLEFVGELMDLGMFNQSTKAVGDVKTKLTPNRYFDVDTALTLVTEDDVKESTVAVVDANLLKQHMTPIQLEKAMKSYETPFKVELAPNVKDED